jgi:hypothetical protein
METFTGVPQRFNPSGACWKIRRPRLQPDAHRETVQKLCQESKTALYAPLPLGKMGYMMFMERRGVVRPIRQLAAGWRRAAGMQTRDLAGVVTNDTPNLFVSIDAPQHRSV